MKDIIQQLLEIEKLAEDVRGKFEAKGISLYPYPRKEYCPQHGEKWNVTVLKGIKALSEQTGVKPFQTNDIWGKPKDGFLGRSEEHTSELQSR